MQSTSRALWGSRLGFILASAGSAVGLGALWKFPYMAGTNGGSAFILPYIIITLCVGFIVLVIEMALGRAGRGGPAQTLRLYGGKAWGLIGFSSVLAGFLILAFYQVIGGWCLNYLIDAIQGKGIITNTTELNHYFESFIENGAWVCLMQLSFLALTVAIVSFGLTNGVERLAKILMPTLFILMCIIIVRGLTLPGAWAGVEFMFKFDASSFTGSSLMNALGFSFFSLSLGSGTMMNYGSYLSNRINLTSSVAWISFLAIVSSLLGGLMVMPTVFAVGLDPAAGPGLTFVTMPAVFAHLPMSHFFAVILYLCLLVAALTTSISILQMSVQYLMDEFGMKRSNSICFNTLVLIFLGILCSLSFGKLSDWTIFGKTFFDLLDYLTSNVGIPLGAMGICIVGGYLAWPKMQEQLQLNASLPAWSLNIIRTLICLVAPTVIVIIAITGLLG